MTTEHGMHPAQAQQATANWSLSVTDSYGMAVLQSNHLPLNPSKMGSRELRPLETAAANVSSWFPAQSQTTESTAPTQPHSRGQPWATGLGSFHSALPNWAFVKILMLPAANGSFVAWIRLV